MHELLAAAVRLLAQAPAPDLSPWAPIVGGGGLSAVLAYLYVDERKERKETDRLLREVYKESSERLASGLATLDKAIEYFERADRPERRGR